VSLTEEKKVIKLTAGQTFWRLTGDQESST